MCYLMRFKIHDEKLTFKETAKSKIGSKDNIGHKPGGGNVKVCLVFSIVLLQSLFL